MSAATMPAAGARIEERRRGRLALTLSSRVAIPIDELELAAVLESMGITDQVAREDYDADDVFSLAAALYPAMRAQPHRQSASADPVPRPEPVATGVGLVLPLAPLVLLAFVLDRLHVAGVSSGVLTAVALGGAMGTLSANALLLPVTQRAAVYEGSDQHALAVRLLVRAAPAVTFIVSLAAIAVSAVLATLGLGTAPECAVAAVAAIALATLLVCATAVGLACGVRWLLAALGAYAAVGLAFALGSPLSTYLDAVAAYACAMAVLVAALVRAELVTAVPLELPWTWRHVREAAPIAGYGALTSTFLGLASIVVWQALRDEPLLAMEIVLLSVLPIALAGSWGERVMWRLWTNVDRALTAANTPGAFGRQGIELHRSVVRSYALTLSVLAGAAAVVFVVGQAVAGEDPGLDPLVVFGLSISGLGLFALGNFDAMFLLGLRCVAPAVRGLAAGTATLGLAAAALVPVGPVAAAAGIPLGGLAFVLACRRGVSATMSELDWHFAEAF